MQLVVSIQAPQSPFAQLAWTNLPASPSVPGFTKRRYSSFKTGLGAGLGAGRICCWHGFWQGGAIGHGPHTPKLCKVWYLFPAPLHIPPPVLDLVVCTEFIILYIYLKAIFFVEKENVNSKHLYSRKGYAINTNKRRNRQIQYGFLS